MGTLASPSVAAVQRIAAIPDAVERNLQITQCYYELSQSLSNRTGYNANWCTFATWASRQAGFTIRKQDISASLEAATRQALSESEIQELLADALHYLGDRWQPPQALALLLEVLDPGKVLEISSQAVGRGNVKVFAEIGYEFARFNQDRLADEVYKPDAIADFCSGMRPGEPPDGQGHLQQAFQHIYLALFEADDKIRTELLLLANLEIGVHEQTRLQPEIQAALDATLPELDELRWRLYQALWQRKAWGVLLRLLALRLLGKLTPLEQLADRLTGALRSDLRRVMTSALMVLELPGKRRLHLGDDLQMSYHPVLQHIENVTLRNLLNTFDATPDSTVASGAVDWADFNERVHFIADLFRCFQKDASLFEAPEDTM